MLRTEEFESFIDYQNEVVSSLRPPPDDYVQSLPEVIRYVHRTQLAPQSYKFQPDLWMRYMNDAHVDGWLELIVGHLARLVARVEKFDEGAFYLGKQIQWT